MFHYVAPSPSMVAPTPLTFALELEFTSVSLSTLNVNLVVSPLPISYIHQFVNSLYLFDNIIITEFSDNSTPIFITIW